MSRGPTARCRYARDRPRPPRNPTATDNPSSAFAKKQKGHVRKVLGRGLSRRLRLAHVVGQRSAAASGGKTSAPICRARHGWSIVPGEIVPGQNDDPRPGNGNGACARLRIRSRRSGYSLRDKGAREPRREAAELGQMKVQCQQKAAPFSCGPAQAPRARGPRRQRHPRSGIRRQPGRRVGRTQRECPPLGLRQVRLWLGRGRERRVSRRRLR